MSLFFPLKSFVSKKNIIPVTDEPAANTTDTRNSRGYAPPKYVKPLNIPLINKKYARPNATRQNATRLINARQTNVRSLDTEDIFKDAKEIDSLLKRDTAKRSLYSGMIQRISGPQTGCKKCGAR